MVAAGTVLIMGRHGSGKRSIASNYIGKAREELVTRERWVSQMKGTKGDVTLMGLPEEHGRMSAYRQRVAAVQKATAFMVVVRNDSPVHYEYNHQMVQEIKGVETKVGPYTVIAGYITDEVPVLNPAVAAWAESIGATVHLLNISKIGKKDDEESKKLAKIVDDLIEEANKPAPIETETVTETETETPTPAPVDATTPEATSTPPAKKQKTENNNAKKPEPKRSAVSRAISYLVNGGSVA